MTRIPTLTEILRNELSKLRDLSEEDLVKLVEYKKLKEIQNINDFLKRHAEDKKRFRKEIHFIVKSGIDYPINPTNYNKNTYF